MKNEAKLGKRPGLFISNSRFYILALSVAFSLVITSYLRLNIFSDTLFEIRLQQVFGFTALSLWYIALLATPLSGLLGKKGWMAQYLYARRAIGVSGAYFAVLHVLLGVFGQLGGPGNLLNLPSRFQQSLIFGAFGLTVLVLMASTSFDRVIKWLTFPRWKWLHRLSYPAITLVLLHVWIIGTHLDSLRFRVIILGAISILVVLESWRISKNIEKASKSDDPKLRLLVFISMVLILIGLSVYIPRSMDRYHAKHTGMEGHK